MNWSLCRVGLVGQEEFQLALFRNSNRANLFADRVSVSCPFSPLYTQLHEETFVCASSNPTSANQTHFSSLINSVRVYCDRSSICSVSNGTESSISRNSCGRSVYSTLKHIYRRRQRVCSFIVFSCVRICLERENFFLNLDCFFMWNSCVSNGYMEKEGIDMFDLGFSSSMQSRSSCMI